MKLLCLALLVLMGHQALANPRRLKRQPFILKPVPAENTKVILQMATSDHNATTGHPEMTTEKTWFKEPRHENVAPLAYAYTEQNRCKEGEFQCDGDLCVAEEKRCDGRVNCKDGKDEDKCYPVEEVVDTMKRESRQGCGGVFSHTSGTIVHPIGGGDYQNNENCEWTINAGTPIRITFTIFQVETRYDRLVIKDGDNSGSGVIADLTGHALPEIVETSGNSAYLQFTSDYSVTFPGFELHWAPSGCGEVYTSSNGVIKHPMSGGNYENNEDCVWKINAAEPIKITFVAFDLETNYDFLYVRNGPNSDSPLLGSLTGSTNSNPIQTTQNSAYLLFSSDYSVTKTGFELRWEPASTTGSSDCACGQVNRTPRIVNGVETEVNEYPWQAAMVQSGSSSVFCGGSVIGSKHILTAAHCTQAVIDYGLTYQVLVGAHQLSSPASSQIRLEAARFIQHTSYNADTMDNDISIIELSGSIDFRSSEIRPVCLPDSDTNTYDNVIATVSGWGRLVSGGSSPDVLMEVDVPTMSNAKCAGLYAGGDDGITDNMLCAAYDEGGKDSCQGDSGGPLIYNPGTGSIQIGVVSWGYGCADARYPGVYARVTKYLPWISTNTASGTTCTAAKSLE